MTKVQCKVDDCESLVSARGFCGKHYYKFRIYGNPLSESPSRSRTCNFESCPGKHFSSGYCAKHFRRWKRTGDPGVIRRYPNNTPARERFWAKVSKGLPDECWLWTAGTSRDGYGWFAPFSHGDMPAHRYAYQLLAGPIPDNLTLDHLCRNILCVNPKHLEAVTNSENVRRAWEYRKNLHTTPLPDFTRSFPELQV